MASPSPVPPASRVQRDAQQRVRGVELRERAGKLRAIPIEAGNRARRSAIGVLVVGHEIDEVRSLSDRGDVIRGGVLVDARAVVRHHVDHQLGPMLVQRCRQRHDERAEGVLVGRRHALEVEVDAAVTR